MRDREDGLCDLAGRAGPEVGPAEHLLQQPLAEPRRPGHGFPPPAQLLGFLPEGLGAVPGLIDRHLQPLVLLQGVVAGLLLRRMLQRDLLDQRSRQQPTHQLDGVELQGGGTAAAHGYSWGAGSSTNRPITSTGRLGSQRKRIRRAPPVPTAA